MIVDCHCHAGKGDGFTGPWDTDAPLGAYLRRAAAAGIDRTILLPAFSSDYGEANRALARIVARAPHRLQAFAMVHAARDRGRIHELVETAVKRYAFRGIKVHRHDAPINREVCEAARRFRLPVLYDIGGDTAVLELLSDQYPDVAFIVPHLGSFGDDWRAQLGVIDHLVRHPNIHADTSGVRRFDLLVQAVRRAGAHKILFGSDGPWLHPGLELAKIDALQLGPQQRSLVLGGNLLRLIGQTPQARPGRADPDRADPTAPTRAASIRPPRSQAGEHGSQAHRPPLPLAPSR
ncbi:MAG: amidohydrolase family protein [Limnobacter sp.]|nr:amidohydrolase family protein [Limnobacter sp.]